MGPRRDHSEPGDVGLVPGPVIPPLPNSPESGATTEQWLWAHSLRGRQSKHRRVSSTRPTTWRMVLGHQPPMKGQWGPLQDRDRVGVQGGVYPGTWKVSVGRNCSDLDPVRRNSLGEEMLMKQQIYTSPCSRKKSVADITVSFPVLLPLEV